MIEIKYHPRAIKFLRKISKKESEKILITIEQLPKSKTTGNLDIKKLINTKRTWRLRIGNIRVVYEYDIEAKIIYIHDIDFRGNIY